jgi:hypothetical protein
MKGLFSSGREAIHMKDEEQCAGDRRDAHADADHEGGADGEEADHEQPVGPGCAGEGSNVLLKGPVTPVRKPVVGDRR